MTNDFVNGSLNLSSPLRRVIVSNETDFFKDFLAQHASEIPTFSGGFGNEWDLYTASMGAVASYVASGDQFGPYTLGPELWSDSVSKMFWATRRYFAVGCGWWNGRHAWNIFSIGTGVPQSRSRRST